MADDKKLEVKSEAKPTGSFFAHPDPFVEIVWTILALVVIFYILNALFSGIFTVFSGDYTPSGLVTKVRDFVVSTFYYILSLKYLFFFLYMVLAGCIMYLLNKIKNLRAIEKKLLYPEIATEEKAYVNPQWERILGHIESLNENDWRLAIIEADIMLSDILDKLALPGDTMGDKLKAVEKSDFTTVENAWEAHKIRNQIAHEGASFMLNQHEAKRVIGLYESVFREFQVI